MKKVTALNKTALKVVIPYFLIASVWIYFSDRLLGNFITEQIDTYQTYKGLFFVIATSVLLYVLISRITRRLELSNERVERLFEKEMKLRRITEKASDELKKTVEEKEILLRELHHRVKNNLAVTAGLIDLQVQEITVPEARIPLQRTKSRIFTIAGIHQLLYREQNLKNIQLDQLLVNLRETVFDGGAPPSVHAEDDIEEVSININQAVPLALLLNEIISIIGKKDASGHRRQITFATASRDESVFQLTMMVRPASEDLPERLAPESSSFEANLLSLLLQQLGAEMNVYYTGSQMEILTSFILEDKRGSSSNL